MSSVDRARTESPHVAPNSTVLSPQSFFSDPVDGNYNDFDSNFQAEFSMLGDGEPQSFQHDLIFNDEDFIPQTGDYHQPQIVEPVQDHAQAGQRLSFSHLQGDDHSMVAESGSVASGHHPSTAHTAFLGNAPLTQTAHDASPLRVEIKQEDEDDDSATARRGVQPEARLALNTQDVANFDDQNNQQKLDEKTETVRSWLESAKLDQDDDATAADEPPSVPVSRTNTLIDDEDSEQSYDNDVEQAVDPDVAEQTPTTAGTNAPRKGITFASTRPWVDADGETASIKGQPETSRAAMARFERRAKELDAMSTRATIGSRRFSDTSLFSTAGISIQVTANRDSDEPEHHDRRTSLLDKILHRSPSNSRKRSLEHAPQAARASLSHSRSKEAVPQVVEPVRTPSRPKAPLINTTDVPRQHGINQRSPKSPGSLMASSPFSAAKNLFHRQRSKSELGENRTRLGDLFSHHGGPPVSLLTPQAQGGDGYFTSDQSSFGADAMDSDSDGDGDDEVLSGIDRSWSLREPESATYEGFKAHIQEAYPGLAPFLVQRLVSEQLKRYKRLLEALQQHYQNVQSGTCPSHHNCAARGHSEHLTPKKAKNGATQAAVFYIDRDLMPDEAPDDKSAQPAVFPEGIPYPPVDRLPARFECPFCFQVKNMFKPSDFTKHVHEDLQPFTCTFSDCGDARSFKRKADWVRHENEAHRRLELWRCYDDSCKHICYRKDNFAQHLVREHKLPEPKSRSRVKSKGEGGLVLEYLESRREDTKKNPEKEPCRFCGKTFNHWKKLTVHMGKHMEHLSLPLLKLVENVDLRMDHTALINQELEYSEQGQMEQAALDAINPDVETGYSGAHEVGSVDASYSSSYGPVSAGPMGPYNNHLALPTDQKPMDMHSHHWTPSNGSRASPVQSVHSANSAHSGISNTRSSSPHSVGPNLHYNMGPHGQPAMPVQHTSQAYLSPTSNFSPNVTAGNFAMNNTGTAYTTYPYSNSGTPAMVSTTRQPSYAHEDFLSASPQDTEGFSQQFAGNSFSYPPTAHALSQSQMHPTSHTQSVPQFAPHTQTYQGPYQPHGQPNTDDGAYPQPDTYAYQQRYPNGQFLQQGNGQVYGNFY